MLHLKKYASRKSPPFPANECCGLRKVGNDGHLYESVSNSKGVCAWKLKSLCLGPTPYSNAYKTRTSRNMFRSPKSRSPKRSPSMSGGWKSVRKSDPALWARVLSEVKREPGRWAAWKAMKADKLYLERGGRFM